MAKINVKKLGSDKNGNYEDHEARFVVFDLDLETVEIKGQELFKDSGDEIIINKAPLQKGLPGAAYNYFFSAAKFTKLSEFWANSVNPPEEPEA